MPHLSLAPFGVVNTALIFGRPWRRNRAGVHQRVGLGQQALVLPTSVDQLHCLVRELVFLQRVPKAQNVGFIGKARHASEPSELAVQRTLVQLFFHGQVSQVPPQLQAVEFAALDRRGTAGGPRTPGTRRAHLAGSAPPI